MRFRKWVSRAGVWMASALIAGAWGGVPARSASFPTSTSRSWSDGFKSLSPLIVRGGTWRVVSGTLAAVNLGAKAGLASQFAVMPTPRSDWVEHATVTLQQLPRPGQGNFRVGLVARASTAAGIVDKWALVLRPGKVSLLNENTRWVASSAFSVRQASSYRMEMVTIGTTVEGKVWPVGTPEPTDWTVRGRFPANPTSRQSGVGLYCANAVARFRQFSLSPPEPQVTIAPQAVDGVFPANHLVRYVVSLRARPATYRLQYRIIGPHGMVVLRGQQSVAVPGAGSAAASLDFRLPPRFGLYTLSLMVTDDATGRPSGLALAPQTLAWIPPARLDAGQRFGLNANLIPMASQPASLAAALSTMRIQGIGWYRMEFNALRIGYPSSPANWRATDALVAAVHRAHLHVLGLLTAWPPGDNPYATHGQVSFAAALRQYVSFVRATVARYMPGGSLARQRGWGNYGVTAWELWNEPTTTAYWQGTPAQYAQLAQIAARAIHHLDPAAAVLAYSYSPQTLLTADSPPAFTGVAWHYYPGASSPDSPVASVYSATAPILTAEGSPSNPAPGRLPLWLTETGWSTQWVTPRQQAAYWVRTALDALAAATDKVFFFTESYPGSGYGEFTAHSAPRITVPAVAALTANLAGYRRMGAVELGSAVRAWLWQDGANTMATLWAMGGRSGRLVVSSLQGRLSAHDWMDNSVAAAKSGQLVLPLGPDPVYVTAHGVSAPRLAETLRQGVLTGIPPVSVAFSHWLLPRGSTVAPLAVTVTNQANRPVSGRISATLPAGWSSGRLAPSFGPLAPGASTTITVPITRMVSNRSNLYPVTMVTTVGPKSLRQARTETLAVLAGAPSSTPGWRSLPVRLDRAQQVVGVPGWTPSVARAKLYTGWSATAFRVGVLVHAQQFFQPFTKANIWQGSSLQLYFQDRTPTAGGSVGIGLAQTPDGPQVYEWSGPSPGLLSAPLKVTRLGSHRWWYQVSLPWSVLGIHPQTGTYFGFDALLNVVHQQKRVGWIALAPGVGNTNLPDRYPSLTLLGPRALVDAHGGRSWPSAAK